MMETIIVSDDDSMNETCIVNDVSEDDTCSVDDVSVDDTCSVNNVSVDDSWSAVDVSVDDGGDMRELFAALIPGLTVHRHAGTPAQSVILRPISPGKSDPDRSLLDLLRYSSFILVLAKSEAHALPHSQTNGSGLFRQCTKTLPPS